jgi:transposase
MRRFDVVAEARRRWSDAEKRVIAAEASPPGTVVSAVARRHGISPSLLFRWLKTHGPLKSHGPMQSDTEPVGLSFLPVAVAKTASPSEPVQSERASIEVSRRKPAEANAATTGIEIALANGRCIRVGAGVDLVTLKAIIDMLEAR